MKRISLLLALIFAVSGCAFGTRRPVLEYSVVLPPAEKSNIAIKVSGFKDERLWSKEKIGDVRNGFGMRCADIIPQNNVADWVTDALKNELNNAGYILSEDGIASNIIDGTVLEVYADAYFNYGGRIRLNIVLRKGDKDLLNKEYSSQKNCGMQWAATAASFGKTMELTLQDVMRQIIPDVNKALLENINATQ